MADTLTPAGSPARERPVPARYGNYREYLADMITYLKTTRRAFSYRSFAKAAGFSSTGFLKHVIDGERNISQRSIPKFARALGLSKAEREIFEILVHFTQAKTDEERNHYYGLLARRRSSGSGPAGELNRAQYEVYTLWYAMPIREMILLPDFREDPEWIAARLYPPVQPAQARRALDLLERVGLIQRDDNGALQLKETKLLATREIQLLAVRNYHRAMLNHALEALGSLPREQRNITSVTLAISRKQYTEICNRIAEFEEELLHIIDDAPVDGDPRDVHVLAFQLFPVTLQKADS